MTTQKNAIFSWEKAFLVSAVLFSVILYFCVSESFGETSNRLFIKKDNSLNAGFKHAKEDPTVVRSRQVNINFDALAAETMIIFQK